MHHQLRHGDVLLASIVQMACLIVHGRETTGGIMSVAIMSPLYTMKAGLEKRLFHERGTMKNPFRLGNMVFVLSLYYHHGGKEERHVYLSRPNGCARTQGCCFGIAPSL